MLNLLNGKPRKESKHHHQWQQRLTKAIIGGTALIITFATPALAQSIPSGCNNAIIDFLVGILPSTPENVKLANVLTQFALEAPIGSATIFEAYSASFQILSLMAFFKGIRLLNDLKNLLR